MKRMGGHVGSRGLSPSSPDTRLHVRPRLLPVCSTHLFKGPLAPNDHLIMESSSPCCVFPSFLPLFTKQAPPDWGFTLSLSPQSIINDLEWSGGARLPPLSPGEADNAPSPTAAARRTVGPRCRGDGRRHSRAAELRQSLL